ncbi:PTS system mannose/fructose/N-acetylgalactosamine-transporter subunit IIB [[Clostridium] innocuum]|uniref:PTS system mannose/fructose/N-acetylgalactosamine-transporter subunit IIB n=1 Tax=Clostridium innocuum TaxID=1522 RepID=UPI00325831F5
MVELCRIDDRLLHGQVAVTWVSAVAPEAILIANDDAATNEMSKLALKMAKPAGIKLAVKTIEDAATLLNNPNAKKIKIFLITRTIQDTLRLVKITDCIHRVNIGGVKNKEGGKMIAATVCLNDEDIQALKELKSLVDDLELRMVPSESKTNIDKYL